MSNSNPAIPLGLPGSLAPLTQPQPLGYAVLDLETTGTNNLVDRIVSFAVIELDPAGIKTGTLSGVVNPECPIPSGATAVHGITDEEAACAPPFREVAGVLQEALAGRALIAFNANFDVPLLLAEFVRAALPFEPLATGCVLNAVQVAYPLAAGHRLEQVAPILGLDAHEDAHDALSDALVAAAITRSLLEAGLDPVGTVLDTSMFFWLRAQFSTEPVTSGQIRRLFAIARSRPELLDDQGDRVDRARLLAETQQIAPNITRFEELTRHEIQRLFDRLEPGSDARVERGNALLAALAERPGRGAKRDGVAVWPQSS